MATVLGHPTDAELGDDPLRDDVAAHLGSCARCRVHRRILKHAAALPADTEQPEAVSRDLRDALTRDTGVARTTYEALDVGAGRYRAVRALGPGTARAFDLDLERLVVVRHAVVDVGLRDALAERPHRNLPRMYSVAEAYHTREYVDGRDLVAFLDEDPRHAQLLDVFGQMVAALSALHELGYAHGAVHAKNVWVDVRGRAVLLDGGVHAGTVGDDWQALGELFAPHLERAPTEISELAASRFEYLGLLGVGGMGEVHRVRDPVLDRVVALKTLKPDQVRRSSSAMRFVHEARITAQLQHPGIVPVHEMVDLPDGTVYFTMKQVVGRTFADVLKSPPHLQRLVEIFLRVCETVAYAHAQSVVHLDLKPGNIMVGEFGEVLVVDWGLARRLGQQTDWDGIAGTVGFMPEEQAAGANELMGAHTDVFALGRILDAILQAAGPSPELAAVARKASRTAWHDRYADAGELVREVQAWRRDAEVAAYEYSVGERVVRILRPHARVLAVATVLTFLLGAAGGLALLNARQAELERAQVLVEKAQLAMMAGDRVRAEVYAAGALQRDDRPEARGLLARVGHAWYPTLLRRRAGCVSVPADMAALCEPMPSMQTWPKCEEGDRRCSPDGKWAAVPDGMAISVWQREPRRESRRLEGHEGEILAIAWSPDSRLLATGSSDGTVRLWDMQRSGTELATLPGHDGLVSVSFSSDGRLGSRAGGVLRLWDVSNRAGVADIHARIAVRDLEWTRSGTLSTVDAHGWVRDWDPASGERRGGVFRLRRDKVMDSSQDFATGRIALALSDGSLLVMDEALSESLADVDAHRNRTTHVAWRPGADEIVTAGTDGTVARWSGKGERRGSLRAGTGAIRALGWSKDGSRLLVHGDDGRLQVLDADGVSVGQYDRVTAAALSADGTLVALAEDGGAIVLVDDGHRRVVRPRGDDVSSLALTADGSLLASAGRDHSVRLWDARTLEERARLGAHPQGATALAFSPDDAVLASADSAGEILLWDLRPVRAPARSMLDAVARRYGASLVDDAVRFDPEGM